MPYQPYNLTQMGNVSGIVPFLQTVNSELMKGYFGVLLLAAIWVIAFMAFLQSSGGDGMKSAATASFISLVICLFLRSLELVPDLAIFVTIIMTAICLFFIKN